MRQHQTDTLQLRFDKDIATQSIKLVLYDRISSHSDEMYVPTQKIEFKKVDKSSTSPMSEDENTMIIAELCMAQGDEMIKELWEMGFRPDDVKDRSDLIASLKDVIRDLMRERDQLQEVVIDIARKRAGVSIDTRHMPKKKEPRTEL